MFVVHNMTDLFVFAWVAIHELDHRVNDVWEPHVHAVRHHIQPELHIANDQCDAYVLFVE